MSVVLLSIFTLGIYDLFWLVKVKKVLNQETDVHTPSIWLLFAPVLVIVALFVVAFATAGGSSNINESSTASTGASIVLLLAELVAFAVIIPITFYWFFKFSKAVGRYTHGELNTAITFILLWLLRFIGIAIIQDKFNDMLAAGTGGTPAMAGAPSAVPANPVGPPAADAQQISQVPAPDAPTDTNQPPQAPAA